MTRGDFFYKWFWYALAALPICLLEDVVFGRAPLFGVIPMLLPLAAVAVAVLEGPAGGAGFGLAMGLMCCAIRPGANPMLIPACIVVGIAVGGAARYGLKQNFPGYLLCCAAALGLMDLGRVILGLLNRSAPLLGMLKLSGLETLCSLLFTPVVWLLLRKVYDRVGGTKLA